MGRGLPCAALPVTGGGGVGGKSVHSRTQYEEAPLPTDRNYLLHSQRSQYKGDSPVVVVLVYLVSQLTQNSDDQKGYYYLLGLLNIHIEKSWL